MEHNIHPELRKLLPQIHEFIIDAEASAWDVDALCDRHMLLGAKLAQYRVLPGVYAVPYLSEECCDTLVQYARAELDDFSPNTEEEEAYQIDELVLAHHDPESFAALTTLFTTYMVPLLTVLHQRQPAVIRSIQLARYNPKGVAHGNWHFDDDSDQTVVVSLNPQEFQGGGTDLCLDLFTTKQLPALPKGYALIFHGKTTLHRGRAVEAGDRFLLVHWTETK